MAIIEKTSSFRDFSAFLDSERQNSSPLQVRQYKDLDLFFTKRSRDRDVNVLTNITAVKRSVRNLILTNFYENPFHPAAEDVLVSYEPRAKVFSVEVEPDLDRNAYDMSVKFVVVNAAAELVELNVLLEVLR